ncbi:MAG: hypothetical protein HQK66_12640, partial [Desulfamplus sp.]|nr:hypothetical protein [Desulfamplus sp.]
MTGRSPGKISRRWYRSNLVIFFLFAGFFRDSGYLVRVLTEDNWDQAPFLCEDIELALISVPIGVTAHVIESLAPHLPSGAVLAYTSIARRDGRRVTNVSANVVPRDETDRIISVLNSEIIPMLQ